MNPKVYIETSIIRYLMEITVSCIRGFICPILIYLAARQSNSY